MAKGGKFAMRFRPKGGKPRTVRVFAKTETEAYYKGEKRLKALDRAAYFAGGHPTGLRRVPTRAQVRRKLKRRKR